MNKLNNIMAFLLAIGICLAVSGQASGADLLPAGMKIKETYRPGVGQPIGKVTEVSGRAVIIHSNQEAGYRAAKNLSIYKNDTLVTLEDGQLGFTLNDGSYMNLSPKTRLQINKSVYSAEQKTRSSFLDMALGRARFVVKKMIDARQSEFKVKTQTSVAGVRGSDFVIFATEEFTEIITLSDTILEVVSLATPEAPPLVMADFEQTRVERGAPPEEARKMEAQEIERLMKEFMSAPPDAGGGAELAPQPEFEPAAETRDEAAPVPVEPVEQPAIEVSESDLAAPEPAAARVDGPAAVFQPLENFDVVETQDQIDQVRDVQERAVEEKSEPVIVEKVITLPDFPGIPH